MKVSIAFDLSLNGTGSFFTLDDATKGVLDNATYVLAGNILTDLTSRVRSVQVKRGRSRQLQRFTAGAANIVFDNRDRGLDPLYSSSPYYGNIVPGKQIAIEHNGATLYTGTVADWNFDYTLSGDAVASVSCTDGLATIAQAVATAGTATAQLSGARINNYLTDAGWPAAQRAISAGQATLGADVIGTNTNSIGYLQKAADSDPGALFVGKTGLMTYKDRADLQAFNSNVTFGGATGIPFTDIKIEYGIEELYPVVNVNYWGGTAIAQVTAQNTAGVAAYGEITNTVDTLLGSSSDATILAGFLANKWGTPNYRVTGLTVGLHALDSVIASQVLSLELGDMVLVSWTPNNIGSALSQYCTVEGIEHKADPATHFVTLTLSQTFAAFQLDSATFGVLDTNVLGF
jgi:hypothetical protein